MYREYKYIVYIFFEYSRGAYFNKSTAMNYLEWFSSFGTKSDRDQNSFGLSYLVDDRAQSGQL